MSDLDNSPSMPPRPVDHQRVFAFLRDARRDRRLSHGAYRLLDELVDRTDKRGGRVCDPSAAELAQACNAGRSSVFRLIGELEALGLVRVQSRAKQRLSTIFEVVWSAYDAPAQDVKPVRRRREQPRRSTGRFGKRNPEVKPAAAPVARHRGLRAGPEPEAVRSPEEQAARAAFIDSFMAARDRPLVAAE